MYVSLLSSFLMAESAIQSKNTLKEKGREGENSLEESTDLMNYEIPRGDGTRNKSRGSETRQSERIFIPKPCLKERKIACWMGQ